ncbi:MAG: hypothetical protein R2851_02620 [Caldilineaceae bacterium]
MNVTALSATVLSRRGSGQQSHPQADAQRLEIALKMHHVDAMQQEDGSWLACVDGATLVRSSPLEGISQNAPF